MAANTSTATTQDGSSANGLGQGFQDADAVLPQYHIEAQTSLGGASLALA